MSKPAWDVPFAENEMRRPNACNGAEPELVATPYCVGQKIRTVFVHTVLFTT